MKVRQTILSLFMLFAAQNVWAQKVFIPEQGEGIVFTASSLSISGAPSSFVPSNRSNAYAIQIFREHIIGLSHFSIAGGVGYSGQYYHGNVHIEVLENGEQNEVLLSAGSFKSNRIATEYADALLEFRYRGNANKKGRFTRIYVGGFAGYRTNAFSHLHTTNYEVKYYHIEGINPLRYGIYARAGKGPINLSASFSLSPIFSSGAMLTDWSEATSTSVGLSLML